MINDLRQVFYFQDLPDEALHAILPKLKHRIFNKNHTLIYEDDTSRDVFILRSGSVKVFSIQEDKEIIFNFFFPGEAVGELEAIYTDYSRIASVEAMETVHAWLLSRDEFLAIAEQYPSVLRKAYCQLVDHIRVLNRKVVYLSYMDVRRKVANMLLDLAYNLGIEEKGRIRINFKLTHHVFANMIGVTRESLSKIIKEFQDDGLIEMKQKTITIVDIQRLIDLYDSDVAHPKQRRWRGDDTNQCLLP
ncbi:Crp/Fnr family transcriptional regulator [Paenibacillus taiwanensis]|uniref:Crp/Fnr family transcriptional regulator n=1 Tax=Paenibacillus taiwanensis TaxID=401638 RepID=UPI0003FECA04|nr:Crp/Fnr family transcriptional regulator [Paenibacillus taiwanensis]